MNKISFQNLPLQDSKNLFLWTIFPDADVCFARSLSTFWFLKLPKTADVYNERSLRWEIIPRFDVIYEQSPCQKQAQQFAVALFFPTFSKNNFS